MKPRTADGHCSSKCCSDFWKFANCARALWKAQAEHQNAEQGVFIVPHTSTALVADGFYLLSNRIRPAFQDLPVLAWSAGYLSLGT